MNKCQIYMPKKSGEEVNLQVEAYGFREMPDKLGAVMRTGEGAPDLVQLDETFFGVFPQWSTTLCGLKQEIT